MHLRSWRFDRTIAGRGGGERGQTNIEYALIVAGIAVLLILAVFALGGGVSDRAGGSVAGSTDGILKPPTTQCDRHYRGACIPPPPPKLDCAKLRARGVPLPVTVVGGDPHGLDPDGDGVGCP